MSEMDAAQEKDWEHKTIHDLLFASLKAQRRKRRWGIFFKFVFFAYIVVVILMIYPSKDSTSQAANKPHTGLIDIRGPIFATSQASADNIATALNRAFKAKGTKGIILRINSPGGSPVQADYIYNEIQRQKKLHPKIKVYAVCTDLCASAAYYIAAAADDIYASPSSLVGSIGVIFNGFGFVDTLKKVGAERRLITAGSHKGFMDPFTPMKKSEVTFTKDLLNGIHQQFIHAVEEGRGNRLKETSEIFSGLIWTGTKAKQMGLIDGFGSAGYVARDVIKQKDIIDYTVKPSPLEQIAKKFGMAIGETFSTKLGLSGHIIQ